MSEQPAYPVDPPRRRIESLTGIRGIACLWVVALHIYPNFQKLFHLRPEADIRLIQSGYLAVDMFFVLSGFILTYTYFGMLETGSRTRLVEFAISRICRIMPLNWFMLAVFLLTAYLLPTKNWSPDTLDWHSFVASIFLMQSWGFANPLAWNFPAWSMSTEWAAYMLFPLMLWGAARLGGMTGAFAGLCGSIALLCIVMIAFGQSTLDHTDLLSLPRCFLQFFAGVCLCRVFQTRGSGTSPEAFMVAGLAILGAAIFVPGAELLATLGFCAIIIACAWGSRVSSAIFGNRPVLFIGEISFSLYLSHAFLIFIFDTVGSGFGVYGADGATKAVFAATMIGIMFAIPAATWRYVELPGQALGRRLVRAKQARTGGQTN
jgi:peptidoglycan/LPS O-acetylase OafA/YrhL